MPTGGLLGDQALGGILRADVAGDVERQKRIAAAEQVDVRGGLAAAHGVYEDELALVPCAVLDAPGPLLGGQAG